MDKVDEAIDNVLIHYGMKGMKWGVVSKKVTPSGRKEAKEKRLETASPEAVRARELRAKAKKTGTQSLTNQELNELVSRMELTSRYSQASAKTMNGGQRFAQEVLRETGKELTKSLIKVSVIQPITKAISDKINE